MSRLYVAAYLAGREPRRLPYASAAADALRTAIRSKSFPYDGGDDPAFFAARENSGPVTWGVCRPDVRGAIRADDWIAFFSAEREDNERTTTRYRFVGALCVEKKIPHPAIFDGSEYRLYRKYLNLLIRPKGSGWEHYEPSAWHDDWLWRICERRGMRKKDVVLAGDRHTPGAALKLHGQPVPIGDNYIIFSKSRSVILRDPPIVANHRRGEPRERWERQWTPLHELLFSDSPRGVRTGNPQRPHRHFHRKLDDPAWPRSLMDTVVSITRDQEHLLVARIGDNH